MAVMVQLGFNSTLEQYNDAMKILDLDANLPDGGMFHVVGAAEDGTLRVTDVWESPEQFQRFVDERLGAAMAQVGITDQPEVTMVPVHNLFAPDLNKFTEMNAGASMP